MPAPIIRVENLGKKYLLRHQAAGPRYRALRDVLADGFKTGFGILKRNDTPTHEEFWALKDVNFEVNDGEVVGIIGRNGAGKSTLLKILSRITEPTAGRVTLNGRVASLLEVGTGFHPELTGRENIFLNGSILGMSRAEIRKKFDEIVAFAEVEKFLDTPVKRYSSGMYVRLAFAVAAHLEPEILVVDEVLAVGDAEFQKKCLGKMGEVAKGGRTVLFVSHQMAAISNLCTRGILMNAGSVMMIGPTNEAIATYNCLASTQGGGRIDLRSHPSRLSGSVPLVRMVSIRNSRGELTDQIECGEAMSVTIHLAPQKALRNAICGIGVDDMFGQRLFSVTMPLEGSTIPLVDRPLGVTCRLPGVNLAPGTYTLSISAGDYHHPLMDALPNSVSYSIPVTDFFQNGITPPATLGKILVRSDWSWEADTNDDIALGTAQLSLHHQ